MELENRKQQELDNKKKKEILYKYKTYKSKAKRIESELEEIGYIKMSARNQKGDGMPHGSSYQSDLSDYFAQEEELEEKLKNEKKEMIKQYKEITERINQLENEKERDVLYYHYIKDLRMWELAKKMDITERWANKLHSKALAHLKID